MTGGSALLGELAVAHYGKALKETARSEHGSYVVYGSNGAVGRHTQALVAFPTIIIGRKGSVGAVTYAPNGGWPIDTTYYLEPLNHNRIDLRYLYWALASAALDRRAITTSIPGLNRDELYRTRILVPQLAEQRRIAALLDKADVVMQKRRKTLLLLDDFLRSAFFQMFGDPVRNEKGWPRGEAACAISEISAGTSVKEVEGGKPKPTEWAVLKISAVTSGWYLPHERKVVAAPPQNLIVPNRGDLLFSRANTRELVAATCLVDSDVDRVFLPDKLWRITPNLNVATAEYLRFLFANTRFREVLTRQATGTSGSMLNVSQEKVLRFMLPLPPLPLQQRFGALVWRAYKLRDAVQCARQQLLGLFESLEQRAFGRHDSAEVLSVPSR